jgi:chemotaxis signal transduction protein
MYLIFKFDDERHFIMDGRKVMGVIAAERILPMPRQRKEVVGLVRQNDLLIPVYDFRLLLGDDSLGRAPLPHLILFYGKESLNAFLAEAVESFTTDCLMVESPAISAFIDPQQVLYNDVAYTQLNFPAIEALLNIP